MTIEFDPPIRGRGLFTEIRIPIHESDINVAGAGWTTQLTLFEVIDGKLEFLSADIFDGFKVRIIEDATLRAMDGEELEFAKGAVLFFRPIIWKAKP
jgi:hypothetical protein